LFISHTRKELEKEEQQYSCVNNIKKNNMNTSALITMICAQGLVVSFAAYFFYKVLTIKPKQEPDSYSENDDELVRQHEEK